ncbi:hypothetical protein, partial [Burkholderia vietnamiensis]|uniref:hypothetical protein n=1 Tax=Burkholderia vietnamiensis TaxID=60552 RepID=UPI001B9EB7BC
IDRRVHTLRDQRIARTLDVHTGQAGASHGASFEYRTVLHTMYICTKTAGQGWCEIGIFYMR